MSSDKQEGIFDTTGEGHVPSDFRKKLSGITTGENTKKLKDVITAGEDTKIKDEDEQDEFEDEDEDEDDEEETTAKPMTKIPTPSIGAQDPLVALAQISPGAKQFLEGFGNNWTDAIKKFTEQEVQYFVEDKNGTYEKNGKRYKYKLRFQDPPAEQVEKIDIKFAKATTAETDVEVVKKLSYAYCYAFSIYYGCDIEIPRKYIPKSVLRGCVDALNWLERQGFRPS